MLFNSKAIIFLVSLISCAASKECEDLRLTGNSGHFTSPNYPNKYDHKANCSWTIVALEEHIIHLKLDPFEVRSPFRKCEKDYVRIVYYEGRDVDIFCTESSKAHSPPELIKSTTNTLTINLITDAFYFNGKGFMATYYVVDKFGNKVEPDEDENDEEYDPGWDESTTKKSTTTTTTPPTTTTPTTTPTTSMTTTTTKSTTVKPTSLTRKIISSTSTELTTEETDLGNGITNNPGAMSGAVIGGLIGVVLLIFGLFMFACYIQWNKRKSKRIDLNVIAVSDDKTLISDNKIYKRINNKSVRDPEAETFPL